MSYRTIKKLLGETSLERKCRFLLGSGLLLLITTSFYFYAHLNKKLIRDQHRTTAQHLVSSVMTYEHWKGSESLSAFQAVIEEFEQAFKPAELDEYSYGLVKVGDSVQDATFRPTDLEGHDALAKIELGANEVIIIHDEIGEYHYYGALRGEQSCIKCHRAQGMLPDTFAEGDLMGMVKISFPVAGMNKTLAFNNAILITTAIVTAFLAMLGAYAIVRYVIVKPVLHLKDVSDEIAHGNLDLRADIRTGDEFEELSHAFNRMLRHLVTVQDELRDVNTDLDGKVDELAQVNLRLYEMNKLKDDFLATMSHELRTPLNSILGFSDVLSDSSNLTVQQQRFLANIQSSGHDLKSLINDLLDLAKIESGRMELQPVEFSIGDLVEQQVGSLQPLAEKKNIDLSYTVDPELELLFQDPTKLQQILNNLLSNAIKFTPEGGRVRLRAQRRDDAWMETIVEDTGIGIPLEDQATIFEKFRQGRSIPGQRDAMTREYGGTGLGLSIVKELSKLLGGEVILDSEFGKGSTFTVRIPVRLDVMPHQLDEDLRRQARQSLVATLDVDGTGSTTAATEAPAMSTQSATGDSHADAVTVPDDRES